MDFYKPICPTNVISGICTCQGVGRVPHNLMWLVSMIKAAKLFQPNHKRDTFEVKWPKSQVLRNFWAGWEDKCTVDECHQSRNCLNQSQKIQLLKNGVVFVGDRLAGAYLKIRATARRFPRIYGMDLQPLMHCCFARGLLENSAIKNRELANKSPEPFTDCRWKMPWQNC